MQGVIPFSVLSPVRIHIIPEPAGGDKRPARLVPQLKNMLF